MVGCAVDIIGRKFIRVVIDIAHPGCCIFVSWCELDATEEADGHRCCVCIRLGTLLQVVIWFEPITWLLDRQVLS